MTDKLDVEAVRDALQIADTAPHEPWRQNNMDPKWPNALGVLASAYRHKRDVLRETDAKLKALIRGESSDPNGTIWECAAAEKARADAAESRAAALEKDAAGWKKLWAEAQTACAKHARHGDALQAQLAQKDDALRGLGHAANDLIDSLTGTAAERRLADLLNRVSEALDKAKAALRQSVPASENSAAEKRGWNKAALRVGAICAEFGHDPVACLKIIEQWFPDALNIPLPPKSVPASPALDDSRSGLARDNGGDCPSFTHKLDCPYLNKGRECSCSVPASHEAPSPKGE